MCYIQITNKCQMTCKHCLFACTRKGVNMDEWVFEKALAIASDRGDYVTIGGGEPTLHPKVFQFIERAHQFSENGQVFIVTNGACKRKALKLVDMAKKAGEDTGDYWLSVALSQDEYHDPIDPEVVDVFYEWDERYHGRTMLSRTTEYGRGRGPEIRFNRVSRISAMGRAAKWGSESTCCGGLHIDPLGNIFMCPCQTVPFGNVMRPEIDDHDWQIGECAKSTYAKP